MAILLFKNLSGKDKTDTVQKLVTHSTPSQDFFLMVILSVVMATIGLLMNNGTIIIGSMLISPMLYSFLSLSLGFSISDSKLISRSAITILKALLFGVLTAVLVTLLFPPEDGISWEIFERATPTLAYGVVAFAAGFGAAFSLAKPQLNEVLPGIAIAVAIIPPLSVIGIGLARLDFELVRGSLLLFALNIISIFAGSIIVFSLMNFYAKKQLADKTIEIEEEKIEKEIAKVEKEKTRE